MAKKNFIERANVDDANTINLDEYTFLERLSANRGTYCFKVRELKRKDF